jgi:hypothetical protein
MLRIAMLVTVCAGVTRASADDAVQRVTVAVAETVAVDVGTLIGFVCDDLTIVKGEMKTKSETMNSFSVTGLAPGTTLCRVGTEPQRPRLMFEIHVVPAKQGRAR